MRGIIDAHQHLWDPSRFSYSWMRDFPSLNVPHRIAEYNKAAGGFSILGSIHVDTDVDEADLAREAAWILALADDPANRILGVVATARLETENCFAHLDAYARHPKLKGVRRVLHTQADAIFSDTRFLKNLASLEERGWSFDLCVRARQLPLALELVKRFPGISFVLDHCGNPVVRERELDSWRSDIRALAAEANVVCKLSGLVTNAEPADCGADALRPFVAEALAAFGTGRVLWGSDWPVCTLLCALDGWIGTAQSLLQNATPEEQDAVFVNNAARVYRLEIS